MKIAIIICLLLQVCLIGFSGYLLFTGGTDMPGLHVALIAVNLMFGALNVCNLTLHK